MAWCQFCRVELDLPAGYGCPQCGYRLEPSSAASSQADALARMGEDETPEQVEVTSVGYPHVPQYPPAAYQQPGYPPPQQYYAPPAQPVIYQQVVHVHAPRQRRRKGGAWKTFQMLGVLGCAGSVAAMFAQVPMSGVWLLVALLVFGIGRMLQSWSE